MPWKITYEGQVYREGDLTLDQAEHIEDITNTTWGAISPFQSASHTKAVLGVMHADRTGTPYDEVVKVLGAVKVNDLLDLIDREDEDDLPTEYDDGFPPKADEPSTPT